MEINIKKIGLLLLVASTFAFFIFKHYKGATKEYEEIYIIQVGAYKNYDNVIKTTREYDNYIIYNEAGLYKIFIGVTNNNNIYEKLIKTYANGKSTFKKVLKITDDEFIKKIKNYDKVLSNTENKNNMNIIIKEELKLLERLLSKNTKK